MNVVLLGIQGSGKGTQSDLLVEKYGLVHITTGGLFRQNIKQETRLGKIAKSFIDKGELVPDEYAFEIVSKALSSAKDGFILDGFPRNLEQTKFLLNKFEIDKVFLLELDDETAIERILARRQCKKCKKVYNILFQKPKVKNVCDICGGELILREDDNKKAICKRIEKFHHETEKVIKLFKEQSNFFSINATQSLSVISKEIISKIN
ncbi:MAG: nucleoside monophosphate kinase [Armatimonadetes bacterium]|nr:nucleoside monophosphate kinase [Armatimonadota bacterium]